MRNKSAVVTGGANGIGRCIAQCFMKARADVIIVDKDDAHPLDGARFYHGDIAEKSTLEAFVCTLDRPVDYLINNACLSRRGILSGCSYEDFEYIQRVGVTAPYYLANLLVQKDLLARGASIVNIASTRTFQS
jgi:NAD(P)-dependent dehydrogenase (short-subunit alcohol dehydrogenase family)